jgi:hypothetical protein
MLTSADPTDDIDAATLTGRIAEVWITEGVERWTLVDETGEARPANRANVKAFMSDFGVAFLVADAAATLYSEAILSPLVARTSASSLDGQTARSTSASSPSSPKRRSPQGPSSPGTSEASPPSTE